VGGIINHERRIQRLSKPAASAGVSGLAGDVADERALALRVLEQLQYDPLLRGRITVETVAWDKPDAGTPMLATLTPQEAIKQGLPVGRSG
jgi:hypothetical protein